MMHGLLGFQLSRFSEPGPAPAPVDGRSRWLALLCTTLAGYALFGKGWAYCGIPPLFIGELVMLAGLLQFFFFGSWQGLLPSVPAHALLMLVAWCVLRTLPYIPTHGVSALRDAAIVGYSAFAVVLVSYLIDRPQRLSYLLARYRQFGWLFLPLILVIWPVVHVFPDKIPAWPKSGEPIVQAKGGDIMVHAAGILAFWVSGLAGRPGRRWVLLLALCIAAAGTFNRGGLLSLAAVVGLCLWCKPLDRTVWRLAGFAFGGVFLLALTGLQVAISEREREVSFDQVVENVASIVSDSDKGDLDGTKQWRLEWWGSIYDYTVEGPYFWTGKGFGINLAVDDGFVLAADQGDLRSPHNGHLVMLARAGVPGFLLWILVQFSWSWSVWCGYRRSRAAGQVRWSGLFLFLLAYWLAFMINASFDVFLEGPMGGIWFWSIFGVGIASQWIYHHHPETLADESEIVAD